MDLPDETTLDDDIDERIKEAIEKYGGPKKDESEDDEDNEEVGVNDPDKVDDEDNEEVGINDVDKVDDEDYEVDGDDDADQVDNEEEREIIGVPDDDDEERHTEDELENMQSTELTPDSLPFNEIVVSGKISANYIEVEEITFNDEPFPDPDIFLEAARLFETVDRNFKAPESSKDLNPYECASESEAALVSLYLGTAADSRPQELDERTIKTGVQPEELAATISFVRYRETFHLFNNPLIKRLRMKRKVRKEMVRSLYRKACSCLFYAILIIFFLLMWLLLSQKK